MRFLQSKTYQFKLIAADKKNPDGRTFFLSSKKEDIRDAWYGELKKVVGTKGSKAVEATEKDGHKDTKEMTEEELEAWCKAPTPVGHTVQCRIKRDKVTGFYDVYLDDNERFRFLMSGQKKKSKVRTA